MTREEVENRMLELVEEAWQLAREYTGREDIFVTMSRHTDGYKAVDAVIDFDIYTKPYTITKLLYCTSYRDGFISHNDLTSTIIDEDSTKEEEEVGKPL